MKFVTLTLFGDKHFYDKVRCNGCGTLCVPQAFTRTTTHWMVASHLQHRNCVHQHPCRLSLWPVPSLPTRPA